MNKTQRGTTVGMKGGKGQNATELLTSKGALHPEKFGRKNGVLNQKCTSSNNLYVFSTWSNGLFS
uniref:Uncharacterized protein n=1 Tax=viral metagenome TaxID=1070528 RepID=A0A6C0IDE7_9ZZZZ